MELIDAAPIPRSREAVWKTLNDPDMLRQVVQQRKMDVPPIETHPHFRKNEHNAVG